MDFSVFFQVLSHVETTGIRAGHAWNGFLACLQFSKPSEDSRGRLAGGGPDPALPFPVHVLWLAGVLVGVLSD